MTEIERLRRELADAEVAAFEAPSSSSYAERRNVNDIRAKLNAAIEATKTPEQRQIEELQAQVGLLEHKVNRLEESLVGSRNSGSELRHIIALHTGKPTAKAIGLIALDLDRIRQNEDELAAAVRAGDLERAQRICINRGLPRAKTTSLGADLGRIGLIGRTV